MKIRIKGNSVRIRITRPEVTQLAADGYLEEKTEFADSTFTYALQTKSDITALTSNMEGQKLTMYVPVQIAAEWATDKVVGHSNTIETGQNKSLYLLLEKDFKCIDGAMIENESDYYDNPSISC